MKLLLWLALALVVIYLLRSKKNKSSAAHRAMSPQPGFQRDADAESMVQCAHCGIYLPASESVSAPPGPVFCSEAHRALHPPA